MFHVKHKAYWGFLSNPNNLSILSNPNLMLYTLAYISPSIEGGVRGGSYLPISTSNTLMSEGDTPGMRDACAKVSGSILISFCRASVERDLMLS